MSYDIKYFKTTMGKANYKYMPDTKITLGISSLTS